MENNNLLYGAGSLRTKDLGSGGTDEKLNVLYTESDWTLFEDKPKQYNCEIFAR